ncbi:MAG: DEAD/DEAH box helicase family protein [Candidatus Moranbacteria bacterium]|nr:DEAD/DEAH box helicase family protein [Candidatus Moranbacteria bacterium]
MLNLFKTKKILQGPDWSFQDEAVKKVVSDFLKEPQSKKLLVIPTGGGKTIVGFKVINELIEKGFLKNGKKAVWIVHTKWLKKQTELKLVSAIEKFHFNKEILSILEIRMKSDARNNIFLTQKSKEYKMVVIDEAHHSAANTYKDFFRPDVNVLGLTATPTRTDDLTLDFKDISYAITFNELVKRKVILLPKFITVETGLTIDARSLNYYSENDFIKFDIDERNNIIAEKIFLLKRNNKRSFNKIIIFVGSNAHVKELYEILKRKNKFYGNLFKYVGYIYSGDNNDLNIDNDSYLEKQQGISSSILVNCMILNEGYDDPSIDTVIMATPSNSILYYMQCVGRVVRNPGGYSSNANVVEMVDKLPNINYRIDNRWLFAEISDLLEPEVIDVSYDFNNKASVIRKILLEHKVKAKYIDLFDEKQSLEDFTLLLFADAPNYEASTWKPIYLFEKNRSKYIDAFNKISANVSEYSRYNDEFVFFQTLNFSKDNYYFRYPEMRISLILALERANNLKNLKQKVDCIKYYTFHETQYKAWWKIIISLLFKSLTKIYANLKGSRA